MNKKIFVKEVIGEKLFPLGFAFQYIDGWDFSRTVKNSLNEEIEQCVLIALHRYSPSVILTIYSNAYGRTPLRLDNFVPIAERHPRTVLGDSIEFADDESFKEVIYYLAEIIDKYVVDKLTEMLEPTTSERFFKDEHLDILKNHNQICADFMEREKIPMDVGIEGAARIVSEGIEQLRGKSFNDVKKSLSDLGVFYACRLDRLYGVKWELVNRSTFIAYKRGDEHEMFAVLNRMKLYWEKRTNSQTMQELEKLGIPVHYRLY